MKPNEHVFGHTPLSGRRNFRRRLREIQTDPLKPLIELLDDEFPPLISNDLSCYCHAYRNYYLSLARTLPAISLAARYNQFCGTTEKYTDSQRRLADRYRLLAPYLELDLLNCIIHARVLMDKVAAVSHRFLQAEKQRPSFASFSDHKKFFGKLMTPYGEHEEYASYIRDHTSWFEMPLKHLRDHYIVHSSPKHMRFIGSSGSGPALQLCIVVANGDSNKLLSKVNIVAFCPWQLSSEIHEFLTWFASYGVKSFSPHQA